MSPRRRRFVAASLSVGLILTASGLFLSPAQAAEPAVFGPGYDSYLNANQRGSTAASAANGEACPTNAAVAGLTAWHFVLSKNTHDFVSLDVAFTIDGAPLDLAGLTLKTTTDWATFDPALHFIADPSAKHAYVYTDGVGTLRDAAAQDAPNTAGPKFQLSHTCIGTGTTTTTVKETTTTVKDPTTTVGETTTTTEEPTTTTEEPTTTTEEPTTTTEEPTTTTEEPTTTTEEPTTTLDPAATSTERDTTTTQGARTSETVGGVQVPRSLPRTGSGSAVWLTGLGVAFLLAGTISLRLGKEAGRS